MRFSRPFSSGPTRTSNKWREGGGREVRITFLDLLPDVATGSIAAVMVTLITS